ncbi:MAG: AGE family epimerase/isomerase, partial [Ignavibacteria bacterium]|nr:AGE family epimerase/isomerase [Ignavibacteria bacterium]
MNKTSEAGLTSNKTAIANEMLDFLEHNILEKWYPLVIDKEYGGYFTNISYDWKIEPEQEKMIVSQARHIWTTAKIANFLGIDEYLNYALHGFEFLKTKMWDEEFGGFFQMRNREGEISDARG